MAVQTIKNIINYDPEEMEVMLNRAKENYENDSSLKWLEQSIQKAIKKNIFIYRFSIVFISVCIGSIIILIEHFSGLHPSIIIPMISAFIMWNFQTLPKDAEELSLKKEDIYLSYFPSGLRYHQQVYQHNCLACYGKQINESKIDITVITEATEEDKKQLIPGLEGHTVRKTYSFDYDGSNPDGILTLDVGNGRVFYA